MRQHLTLWTATIVLGAMLVILEVLMAGQKRWVLMPLPSLRPRNWLAAVVILAGSFPLATLGVVWLPLAALLLTVYASITRRT